MFRGGADSDIMLDLLDKCDPDKKIKYIWFDTGLEYQATKDHLSYLEQEYEVEIERIKPIKPIPLCVKEYGIPFLSKKISTHIENLQKRGFKWEDEPYEVLNKRYPKTVDALKWWCNARPSFSNGTMSSFNIGYNKYLKEFLMTYPPTFKISAKCCMYAKKKTAKEYNENADIDLNCMGIRRSEGGRRRSLSTCYTVNDDKYDDFRPILWYLDTDREYYKNHFSLNFSDCYEVWGMTRTGCCGCPFDRKITTDLELIKRYEPKLYKACINIFGESYEYTRKFKEFQKIMKEKEKNEKI